MWGTPFPSFLGTKRHAPFCRYQRWWISSRYSAFDVDKTDLGYYTQQYTWTSGKRQFHSHIYKYDYRSNDVLRIPNCLPGYSFGQAVWNDSFSFYCIGWKEEPYHDPFNACSTLPSSLFLFSFDTSSMLQIDTTVSSLANRHS